VRLIPIQKWTIAAAIPAQRPVKIIRVASNLLAACREIAHMSAIADLFRLLESHFDALPPAVHGVLLVIGIYSLSFLAIRFVIFIYCKWKSDGLSNASATALAMLLTTLLWPAFIGIWAALSAAGRAFLPDRILIFFRFWIGFTILVGPVSSAMGLLLLVVYLMKVKRLSPFIIYICVAAAMFLQCLYVAYVDIDLGSK
jgi:hypothetical protein